MTTHALPAFVTEADLTVVGTITAVVELNRATVRRVFSQVDAAYLKALVRSEPDQGFELLIGEDVVSLWFAGRRLAVVTNKASR